MAISLSQTLQESLQRKYFRRKYILRILRMPLAILLLIVLFECTIGNIPFWKSVAGSTDSFSAHNHIGAGIQRLHSGGLRIVDPSEAYIEVISDGSSPYIRLQPAIKQPKNVGTTPIISDIHVRVDVNGIAGKLTSANPRATNNALIPVPEEAIGKPNILRIWIQHPFNSIIDLEDARANVRAPFSWSWGRVAMLAIAAFIIALLNPWSHLWKIRLNTSSIYQRLLFIVILSPFIISAFISIIDSFIYSTPLHFDVIGNYTYDFDQYDHTAQAILHGQTYLNLPVPHELRQLSNPYDPSARNILLSNGVRNIYWDHAYYQGHWYSYFGVIPTIFFFLPYRAISMLFVPNGRMLPTSAVTFFCIIVFLIAGSLLIINLIKKIKESPLLATTVICVALFLITSNITYLWFRPSFYSIPIVSSLMFTTIGLCCWLKARKDDITINSFYFSLGTFFISLNLGCRPTFTIALLLALPLFRHYIFNTLYNTFTKYYDQSSWKQLARLTSITLIPIAIIALPLGFYNAIRFGSPFNFGNEYQITVTDMTRMHIPSENILPSIFSYLILPLRTITKFPWIAIQPISFSKWQYAEPMIGGIFSISPLALLGQIASFIFYKRNKNKYVNEFAITSIVLGIIVIIFDSLKAGIGWRYIADFSWLIGLSAVIGIALFLEKAAIITSQDTILTKACSYSIRAIIAILLVFSLVITFLSWFIIGREDSLIQYNPELWYSVRAWFNLL